MPKKIAGAVFAVIVLAPIAGGPANRADEFTQEDVTRWQSEVPAATGTRDCAARHDQPVPSAAPGGREPLALDDPRLLAMEAYATYERRGVALDPGKH